MAQNTWYSLIDGFAAETKKYTNGDFYSFFVSEFSTTTAIDKTAYQVTMLEGFKKGFEYVGDTGCGIPSIHLSGTPQDWKLILRKLDMLNNIGLENWSNILRPIISEFINASERKVNRVFWKEIYKNASEYNGFYISGWIIKFFPYIKELDEAVYDEKTQATKANELILANPFLEGDKYLKSTLSTDNFTSGIAKNKSILE